MAQIDTTQELVLVHRKDGEVVAVTLSNGSHTLYKVEGAMTRENLEKFYEANNSANHGSNKQPVRGSEVLQRTAPTPRFAGSTD